MTFTAHKKLVTYHYLCTSSLLSSGQVLSSSKTRVTLFGTKKDGTLNNKGTTNFEPYPHKNGEQKLSTFSRYMYEF